MSNPLASAEARQAAERIGKEVYPGFTTENVDKAAAIIAESYADLVRERDRLRKAIAESCDDCRSELFCPVANRAESLNRELVEALKNAAIALRRIQNCIGYREDEWLPIEAAKAEAAINSATPKEAVE